MPPFKFVHGTVGNVLDTETLAWVPDTEAVVQVAIAAGEVLPADPPPLVFTTDIRLLSRIRTTDATPTELIRSPLASMTGYRAKLNLLAVDAGNGALRFIEASIVAKRLAGAAILVGTPVIIANHQDAGAATWVIAASVSGNDFIVTVTGAAGRSVDWSLEGSVLSFTPGGA